MESKYHSRKAVVDGREFDSRKEAMRYQELRLLERAGEIKNLQCQVRYELIPAQYAAEVRLTGSGKTRVKRKCVERACTYMADFVYQKAVYGSTEDGQKRLAAWEPVVEDVKGVRTEAYRIKRKLFLSRYGIQITEV